jgi:plastocyanin
MRLLGAVVLAAMIPLSLYACSEDESSPTKSTLLDGSTTTSKDGSGSSSGDPGAPTPDSSVVAEAGPDATPDSAVAEAGPDGATPDAGPDADAAPASNGTPCTQVDFDAVCGPTGGDCSATTTQVDVTFPTDAIPEQYAKHCVKVKVGTDIGFTGDFVFHPLEPHGGDTPTPIPTQTDNPDSGTLLVTMNAAGTYGFRCSVHPAVMWGAIQVVP